MKIRRKSQNNEEIVPNNSTKIANNLENKDIKRSR
jgi:hypothetical protein